MFVSVNGSVWEIRRDVADPLVEDCLLNAVGFSSMQQKIGRNQPMTFLLYALARTNTAPDKTATVVVNSVPEMTDSKGCSKKRRSVKDTPRSDLSVMVGSDMLACFRAKAWLLS